MSNLLRFTDYKAKRNVLMELDLRISKRKRIMVLLFDCFTLDIELISLLYVQEAIIHFIDNR